MKKSKITLFAVIATVSAMIFTSCTIQKRHYTSGYSIQWAGKKGDVKTNVAEVKSKLRAAGNQNTDLFQVVRESAHQNDAAVSMKQENMPVTASATSKKMPAAVAKMKPVIKINVSNMHQLTELKSAKASKTSADISPAVYIILCIFIPFVAVGLATDWGIEVVYNLLWMLLCGFPAIIHAFIVCKRLGKL